MKRKETTSTKKRVFFSFFKKHRSIAVGLVILAAAVGSFLVVNYGRYVKEIIQVYYLRTKNFYFNSDKLTIVGKTYEISPWSGAEVHEININLDSKLNDLKATNSEVAYTVSCEDVSAKVMCYFDPSDKTKTSVDRTIYTADHKDNFNVHIEKKSGAVLSDGEEVQVTIVARATSPYEEELRATFKLKVGHYGINYSLEDVYGRLYLDALVSNTDDAKRAEITLEIADLSLLSIDMSNNILAVNSTVKTNGNLTETDLQGGTHNNSYIKTIKFYIEPKSSIMVRYYKSNPSQKYTENSGVLNFTGTLVN